MDTVEEGYSTCVVSWNKKAFLQPWSSTKSCQGKLFHLCMVCNWLVSRTEKHFSKHDKAFLPQPTASWSSCSIYFTNHSIHSPPKQCFLTLTMCPVHQISQLIVTMSTHKVCYLNFARLLHRTSSTPNSTVGHLLLVSLCMRIIAKLDIQPSYACRCVDITRAGARYQRSLGTRPFAVGGRVWALACIRDVPRTECWPDQSESLIAKYVMEMVFFQAFSAAND